MADLDDPKFRTTDTKPDFVRHKVDLIGRSVRATDFSDPVVILRGYLRGDGTESARCLAQKGVILIEAPHLVGKIDSPATTPSHVPSDRKKA